MAEQKTEDNIIKIEKSDLWKYGFFIVLALLVVAVFFIYTRAPETPNPNPIDNNGGDNGGGVVPTYSPATVDDDPVLGDADAPVTIIEFSDYECPFCGRHFQEVYPLLKTNYIDTGKAKLVYRDFPLSFHPTAMPAAIAAECVGELKGDEVYFEYHDKLFQNQQTLTNENLKKWAKELGANIDKCLDDNKYQTEVQADMQDGSNSGVGGTPGFWIVSDKGSYFIAGAYPYSEFQTQIDLLL